MAQPTPDLTAIRDRLDDVDDRLVSLLVERGALIEEVIHYKRANNMAVVDRAREDRMMERITGLATERGLDPRVATSVLRAIVDAFTLVEAEELPEAPGASPPAGS